MEKLNETHKFSADVFKSDVPNFLRVLRSKGKGWNPRFFFFFNFPWISVLSSSSLHHFSTQQKIANHWFSESKCIVDSSFCAAESIAVSKRALKEKFGISYKQIYKKKKKKGNGIWIPFGHRDYLQGMIRR